MEEKLGRSPAILFHFKKVILAEEETLSAGGWGLSSVAF